MPISLLFLLPSSPKNRQLFKLMSAFEHNNCFSSHPGSFRRISKSLHVVLTIGPAVRNQIKTKTTMSLLKKEKRLLIIKRTATPQLQRTFLSLKSNIKNNKLKNLQKKKGHLRQKIQVFLNRLQPRKLACTWGTCRITDPVHKLSKKQTD